MSEIRKGNRACGYLEVIRIIAIVLVILHHIDITWLYYHNTDHILTFAVSLLVTVVVPIDVPLFFMVSGALLLDREEDVPTLFRKRVVRIILVLLIFSLVQYMTQFMRGKISDASLVDFLRRLMSGNIQQTYWFLYAYIGYLLILPFLRKICRTMTGQEFLLLVILKAVIDILPAVLPVTLGVSLSTSLTDPIEGLMQGGFYAICGYWLNHHTDIQNRKNRLLGYLGIGIGILIPFLFVLGNYLHSDTIHDFIMGTTTWMITMGVFFSVKQAWVRTAPGDRITTMITGAGSCVFGIYLTEQLVRVLFYDTYIYMINHTVGVIASFVYALETFVGAFVIVLILRKIPGIKNLL